MTIARGMTRRAALLGLATAVTAPGSRAFGDAGAFHPRLLAAGGAELGDARATAPTRWAFELVRRTNAAGRSVSTRVRADQSELLEEPFAIWAGSAAFPELSAPEVRGLRAFLLLGGMLLIDDLDPETGGFGRSVRRDLARIVPEHPLVELGSDHVLYHSFYLVDRPVGRRLGPPKIQAITRGKNAQVLLLAHDLLGALARSQADDWSLDVSPGGARQREQAVRFAVNIAMYLLCSDYKDDQVHAPWLMRRRTRSRP